MTDDQLQSFFHQAYRGKITDRSADMSSTVRQKKPVISASVKWESLSWKMQKENLITKQGCWFKSHAQLLALRFYTFLKRAMAKNSTILTRCNASPSLYIGAK